jgi:putative ABC transport system substrate-binding protein
VKRREFITLLGGAAAWPLAARGQQATPVVGYLRNGSRAAGTNNEAAFREGLSSMGFVEGRNLTIDYRYAEYDRLPAAAADLVARQVTVIFANGPGVVAAKAATSKIPIIFNVAIDPVAAGFVTSLSRPGGNLTGVTSLGAEVGPKRLELLHELIPMATTFGVLVDPANPLADAISKGLQAAASGLGLQLAILHANSEREIDQAFAKLLLLKAGGLIITPASFLGAQIPRLVALSLRHAVPAISNGREFVAAGGLMSYGGSVADGTRLAGIYTGRILKGEKPGDLPVQQATKVELFINKRTAQILDLTFPTALLVRADEVIE